MLIDLALLAWMKTLTALLKYYDKRGKLPAIGPMMMKRRDP